MSEAHWHIVSYDVRDDKRRRRVLRHLGGWGERIQYSVFRVHGGTRHLIRLRWELARLMDPVDSLLIIPVPDSAAKRIHSQYEQHDWTEDAEKTYRIVGATSITPSPSLAGLAKTAKH